MAEQLKVSIVCEDWTHFMRCASVENPFVDWVKSTACQSTVDLMENFNNFTEKIFKSCPFEMKTRETNLNFFAPDSITTKLTWIERANERNVASDEAFAKCACQIHNSKSLSIEIVDDWRRMSTKTTENGKAIFVDWISGVMNCNVLYGGKRTDKFAHRFKKWK